ncbi:MAG: hypothetical protein H7222_13335, partial [Methylotenera sp.]|nr:hypothetical protein [Oligoflexia bacterium]
FADLTGHNGWQKGKSDGRRILLEDQIFKPLSTPVSQLDLKNAFGRSSYLSEMKTVCTYMGPKKGSGSQPGIKINCGGLKLKAKFGEVHVQPLATRIFWALGYNVNPADHHPGLTLVYDRKIFEEFNSRVGVPVLVGVGPLSVKVAQQNPQYEGTDYMVGAVLKNGEKISAQTLAEKVADEDDEDIASLLTAPVQLQYQSIPGHTSIGFWDYNDLDHPESKALRTVGVLAAWLGLYDMRRGNNDLVLQEANGGRELKFVFPDLGAGLGRSGYRLPFNKPDRVDLFKSTIASRNRIRHAQTIEFNAAFRDATAEDFAEGVRLINQFSEVQLHELLSISGYTGKVLELFHEKLLSRRASLNESSGYRTRHPQSR